MTDKENNILFKSRLTQYTDIPLLRNKSVTWWKKSIPRTLVWLEQDDHDDVLFRVRVIETELNGLLVSVHIAKPIEGLEEELLELIRYIGISLALVTLIIVVLSYKLAGKILDPVVAITRMAKEISETSLDQRIPLKTSRDELYYLSISLNKMFDRLQYSFQRQKEFIGNASHELKSPITLLMLAQEEMLMNDNLPSSTNKGLIRQLNTTRRMSHLVKNLLDLSRLEQQEMRTRKQVNLTTLVNRVIADYEELLAAKGIIVENHIKENLIVQGNPEKLFRLLINLVDNGIRYNLHQNGSIIVRGQGTARGIILEILNTGLPIPEQDIEFVFEQFYRVEKSRSLIHGGSGLGLAIAKKIVELQDGIISIANEPGGFIKVTVSLPSI